MTTKLEDKDKLIEAKILAERIKFYTDHLLEMDLYDLNENIELRNLAYMFIEQLHILNLEMLELIN